MILIELMICHDMFVCSDDMIYVLVNYIHYVSGVKSLLFFMLV